jgi:protein-S-isoprenylcysteine O-methyltransferase Ste14
MWIVVFAAMTACNWIGETGPWNMFGGAHWLKAAAVIVIAMGLTTRGTAIVTLGKAFSSNVAILDSQKIMKDGLYRFVRHPSYLGLLLVFAAVGLHSRNWIAFTSAVVPTTAAMLYRIHVEELALNAAFGEEYSSYSRET